MIVAQRKDFSEIALAAADYRKVLVVGCGTCVAVCPSKSADLEGFTEQQVYAMVESLV